MTRRFEYECVMCGNIREAKQPTRTCSPACRKAYERYRKRGGEELAVIEIGEAYTPTGVTGVTGVTTPPSHEQAEISAGDILKLLSAIEKLGSKMSHMEEILISVAAKQHGVEGEKKSDFAGATLPPPRITIDPSTVKVTEVDESKRREISINNAMAALDDF